MYCPCLLLQARRWWARHDQWRDTYVAAFRLGMLLGNLASLALAPHGCTPLLAAYYYSAERRRFGLLFVAVKSFTFGRVSEGARCE